MLLTKEVEVKWNSKNKKWYENKGYKFTKWKDIFKVSIDDLSKGAHVFVKVQCDNCKETLKEVEWNNYNNIIKKYNGKYYCHKCAMLLYGKIKELNTKLKNSVSFYQWCYENLSKEEADKIMARWDYDLNIKNGKVLSPKDVTYGSEGFNKKGYWFKCLGHPEHESELKCIKNFTKGEQSVNCNQCNSISITHPHLIKYFTNKEDTYKYSHGSNVNVPMQCPICGLKKNIEINTLSCQGFGCNICGDGISYPNKFIANILFQLESLIFKPEKSFVWSNNKRYDFYIEYYDYVIEVHGGHHYDGGFSRVNRKSLLEEQENDKVKEQLAKNNGIKNYIILDCRESDMEFIKQSVLNSELSILFDLSNIDWLKCHEYACSSLVKEVCDLWDNSMRNIISIAEKLKISTSTVREYLKLGSELSWCDYNGEVEALNNIKCISEKNKVKVVCLTTGEIFNSLKEASKKYNMYSGSSISQCCKGKLKSTGKFPDGTKLTWMYYDEYIKN